MNARVRPAKEKRLRQHSLILSGFLIPSLQPRSQVLSPTTGEENERDSGNEVDESFLKNASMVTSWGKDSVRQEHGEWTLVTRFFEFSISRHTPRL